METVIPEQAGSQVSAVDPGTAWEKYRCLVARLVQEGGVDPQDRDDVIQEVWWKYCHRHTDIVCSHKAWLARVAVNQAADWHKSKSRLQTTPIHVAEEPAEKEQAADSHYDDLVPFVKQAVSELPDEQRQEVELRFFKGLKLYEIAEQTGRPLSSVDTRIRTAMPKLREILSERRGRSATGASCVAVGAAVASGKTFTTTWGAFKGAAVAVTVSAVLVVAAVLYSGNQAVPSPPDAVAEAPPQTVSFNHSVDQTRDSKLGPITVGKAGDRRYYEHGSVNIRTQATERVTLPDGQPGWRLTLDLDVRARHHVLRFIGAGGQASEVDHQELTASERVVCEGRKGDVRIVTPHEPNTGNVLKDEMLSGARKAVADELAKTLPE